MSVKKFRFVPHPDDAVEVGLLYNNTFDEITIHIDDSLDGIGSDTLPFITQVNERMTIQNSFAHLTGEYANTAWNRKIQRED